MSKLIDADKFLVDETDRCCGEPMIGSSTINNYYLSTRLDAAPEVKNATMKDLMELCANHDFYADNPIEVLDFILTQYQKVIVECTGGLLSKLTYDADVVISHIFDKADEQEESLMKHHFTPYELLVKLEGDIVPIADAARDSVIKNHLENWCEFHQDVIDHLLYVAQYSPHEYSSSKEIGDMARSHLKEIHDLVGRYLKDWEEEENDKEGT